MNSSGIGISIDFQSIMQPVLAMLADDQEHPVTEIRQRLAERFSLSQDELETMLPSGRAKMFANRVGWATTYLYQRMKVSRSRLNFRGRGRVVLPCLWRRLVAARCRSPARDAGETRSGWVLAECERA